MLSPDTNEYIKKTGLEMISIGLEGRDSIYYGDTERENIKVGALLLITSILDETLRYLKKQGR